MDVLIALLLAAAAQVCPDPAKPCGGGFKAHDLPFPRATDGVPRGEERSAPFYAVILMSAKECSIDESRRLRIQSLFPGRKVFSHRFECDGDVENNVTYTNVDRKRAFVAVHGGATREEAAKVAADAKGKGFAGANVRRMQVVFVHP
jgi:hypothetical protein